MKRDYNEELKRISDEGYALTNQALAGSAYNSPSCRALYYLENSENPRRDLKKAERIIGHIRRCEFSAADRYARAQNVRGNLYLG